MPWTTSDVDRFNSGLTQSQKEQWVEVANSALESCLNGGGSRDECESSAIRQANGVVNNAAPITQRHHLEANYQIRQRQFMGRSHLVAPVVLMVEGVHNGSQGPTLHPREELAKYPQAWNGRPVPILHPEDDQGPVSANDPTVLENQSVGWLFNVDYRDGKLKGEIWVDEERARRVAPSTLGAIRSGRGIEVSTGAYVDPEPRQGQWNGEEYHAIARNIRPDHLALLPGAQGACSWDDGCGVRVNRRQNMTRRNRWPEPKTDSEAGNEPGPKEHPIQVHQFEEGFHATIRTLQSKLDSMDGESKLHFLEEAFEDSLVYRVENTESGEDKLFRAPYTIQNDGNVEIGEPVQVRRQVSYEPVEDLPDNMQEHPMTEVDKLIQNRATAFAEEDRQWLEALSEAQLAKLMPAEPSTNSQPEPQPQTHTEGGCGGGGEITKEQAMAVLKEGIQDKDAFLNMLPSELREQFEHGLQLHQSRRQECVQRITANCDAWTAEELQAKPMGELEKLAKAIQPAANYAPLGGGRSPTANGADDGPAPLLPTGVQEAPSQQQ